MQRFFFLVALLAVFYGAAGTAVAQSEGIAIRPPPMAVSEGGAAVFVVTTPTVMGVVSVTYTVRAAPGSGVSIGDFASPTSAGVSRTGDLPFAGELAVTSKGGVVTVPIYDDGDSERAESFLVDLGGGVSATATIAASDPIEISGLGVSGDFEEALYEGEEFVFFIELDLSGTVAASTLTLFWEISTANMGAQDARGIKIGDLARSDAPDFPRVGALPITGTLAIAPGDAGGSLLVDIFDDGEAEPLEFFRAALTGFAAQDDDGAYYKIGAASASVAYIAANDQRIEAGVYAPEAGVASEGEPLDFSFVLTPESSPLSEDLTAYFVVTGTGITAGDFEDAHGAPLAVLPTTAVIAANKFGTILTLRPRADAESERAERFRVLLQRVSGGGSLPSRVAAAASSATATIRASDPIDLRVGGGEAIGEGGEFEISFIVVGSAEVLASTLTLIWEITTANVGAPGARDIEVADLADPDGDTAPRAGAFPVTGTLTAPAGSNFVTFAVASFDDERVEPPEFFRFALTEVVHGPDDTAYYRVDTASAALFYISASDREVMVRAPRVAGADEGEPLDFTFALSEESADVTGELTLHIEISGTGITAGDFEDDFGAPLAALPTTAAIRAGTRTATLRLRPRVDGEPEDAERFRVRLLRATGGGRERHTNHVSVDGGASASATINASARDVVVDARVYLQGAYDARAGVMGTGLIDFLPRRQPYGVAPWRYPATTTVAGVAAEAGLGAVTSTIVDWVLMELRTGTSGTGVAAARPVISGRAAGLLLSDGRIAGINSDAPSPAQALSLGGVHFARVEVPQSRDVYVLIHHRNHLSAVSDRLTRGAGCTAGFCMDFRDTRTAGQMRLGAGAYGMAAGDVDRNGVIDARDELLIRALNLSPLGARRYAAPNEAGNYGVDADVDFDGEVLSADRYFIIINR